MELLTADFVMEHDIHKIAFGSCHKNKYADANVWKTIADEQAQAFVWTGDAVYPPVRDIASLDLLAAEYDAMLHNSSIGYSQFLHNANITELWGVYDDHDFGGNDRGHEMPEKLARARLFWKFLHDHNHRSFPSSSRSGLYYSVLWLNNVRLLVLDTRWNRQDGCIPSVAGKFPLGAGIACITRWLTAGLHLYPRLCLSSSSQQTVLGEEQWEWLEEQVGMEISTDSSQSDAGLDIIVSSIQVLTTNPAMESWGQFPDERERLLRLLQHNKQRRRTLLVSGDVHYAELAAAENVVEVTSSGLTHTCANAIYGPICQPLLDTFSRHRLQSSSSSYYIGRNYGTIEVLGNSGGVRVNVHDATTGNVVLSTDLDQAVPAPPAVPCIDGHLIPLVVSFLVAMGGVLVWRRKGNYYGAGRSRRRGLSAKQ